MNNRTQPSILVVDGDRDTRSAMEELLLGDGFSVHAVDEPGAAAALLDRSLYDLVLADADSSLVGVRRLLEAALPIPVGILTGWQLQPPALGGFAFMLQKPFDLGQLLTAISAALGVPPVPPPTEAAVRAYFDALDRRDWDALGRLCTDDVEYALPGTSPFSTTVKGKQEFLALTRESFALFPLSKFDRLAIYATPAGACARYSSRWATDGGEPQDQSGAVSFELAGEQIRRISVRLNLERLPAKRA